MSVQWVLSYASAVVTTSINPWTVNYVIFIIPLDWEWSYTAFSSKIIKCTHGRGGYGRCYGTWCRNIIPESFTQSKILLNIHDIHHWVRYVQTLALFVSSCPGFVQYENCAPHFYNTLIQINIGLPHWSFANCKSNLATLPTHSFTHSFILHMISISSQKCPSIPTWCSSLIAKWS